MTYCKIYENNTLIKSVETDTSNLNTTYKSIRVTKSSIEFINKSGSTHLSVSIGKSIPGYTMADQWKLISHQNDFASYHNFPYKIDNTNSISHSIYIQYEPNKYDVIIDPNGASGDSKTIQATYDDIFTVPTCPFSRTGYTFKNWNTSSNGSGSSYTPESVFKWQRMSDLSLYAQWTANLYTIYFNANGGSISTGSKTVTYDSTYGTLPVPSRIGYTFSGWYT
ncbi:InlB B-repeat-containing protein [Candidatus Methanomassiliicoccus intestinalis]|jgi:hypothetical protein|uniref:InlB B-repeat-containing protein n=1 Tax=Candidatus Methanomassiliicoccus intestinalis TaxID=1406512 RepID=UPI0037DC0ECF